MIFTLLCIISIGQSYHVGAAFQQHVSRQSIFTPWLGTDCRCTDQDRAYHRKGVVLVNMSSGLSSDSDEEKGIDNRGPVDEDSGTVFNEMDDQDDNIDDIPTLDVKVNQDDDLSDRFKYKVQALMGAFDPSDPSADTEDNNCNIYNALLQFPVIHTFTVVGRRNISSTDSQTDPFVAAVQALVLEETGELEDRVTIQTTPRGSKFLKVTISVPIQSAQMMSAIYDKLKVLEGCVMQF